MSLASAGFGCTGGVSRAPGLRCPMLEHARWLWLSVPCHHSDRRAESQSSNAESPLVLQRRAQRLRDAHIVKSLLAVCY